MNFHQYSVGGGVGIWWSLGEFFITMETESTIASNIGCYDRDITVSLSQLWQSHHSVSVKAVTETSQHSLETPGVWQRHQGNTDFPSEAQQVMEQYRQGTGGTGRGDRGGRNNCIIGGNNRTTQFEKNWRKSFFNQSGISDDITSSAPLHKPLELESW